jgi:hypothetical protein
VLKWIVPPLPTLLESFLFHSKTAGFKLAKTKLFIYYPYQPREKKKLIFIGWS